MRAQPNLFGVAAADCGAVVQGDFRGDTRRGGSCNVMKWSLIPHCHGTHTESVSHIVHDDVPVVGCVGPGMFLAVLRRFHQSSWATPRADSYPRGFLTIRSSAWTTSYDVSIPWKRWEPTPSSSARFPTTPRKLVARYDRNRCRHTFRSKRCSGWRPAAYSTCWSISPPSIAFLTAGQLRNHHCFWSVAAPSRRVTADTRVDRTITEFCYVPDDVTDGVYLLNLQVSDVGLDATPSRPLLWPLAEKEPS